MLAHLIRNNVNKKLKICLGELKLNVQKQLKAGRLHAGRFKHRIAGRTRAFIRNITTFCDTRAKVLSIRAEMLSTLTANTEKALKELAPDKKRKIDEQIKMLQNLVKDLTGDMRDMLTRFYFLKERKQRKHEQMTDDQTKILVDFANFTKTLTKKVHSLLTLFRKADDQTFEEKLDEEIKQIETYVKKRLKEFDRALTGKSSVLKKQSLKYVENMVSGVAKTFNKDKSFGIAELKRAGKNMAGRLTKAS